LSRGIFWTTKPAKTLQPVLFRDDEEMLTMRYRGQIESFNENMWAYERHML
jgi:hypothetical protein